MKYGYLLEYASKVEMEDNLKLMQDSIGPDGCLMREKIQEGINYRPKWMKILEKIQEGDELHLIRFSEAMLGLREISMLFEYGISCRFRIISILDHFDSGNPDQNRVASLIGSLPMDKESFIKRESKLRNNKKRKKRDDIEDMSREERNKKIIELYQKGVAIPTIMGMFGFGSNNSVYNILRANNIPVVRHVTSRTRYNVSPSSEIDGQK